MKKLKKIPAKRIDIVSIKMVKDGSIMYGDRKISSPDQVVEIANDFIDIENNDREIFIAIYLNTKNEPVAVHTVSQGSLNASIVHPREVMKGAILSNSNSMIFVHNHPSGNPTPSNEDKNITDRLIEAGELMGIKVLDHVIVGEGYYSFKEEGLI